MNESDDATWTSQVQTRERRSTRFTGIYNNSTRLEDIINETCPTEMTEVVYENAAKASQYLRTLDVTIVDVLRNDLYHETQERIRKKSRKWFQEQGAVELLEICAKSCSSSAVEKAICELATAFFTKELDEFISTGDISQPTTTVTPETMTSFSVHTLSKTMTRRAPLLSHLFQGLVGDKAKTAGTPICDPENGLGFSDEEEEASAEGKLSNVAQRREKRQTNRWVTSLSTICYARRRGANLQQQVMGYYLVSANTPKRVLEVLHQLGISVSYSSVVATMKTIAAAAMKILRNIPKEYPHAWFSKDNMDFTARVRDQRLDHQGELMHQCAGYVAINVLGIRGPRLTANDINKLRATNISARDILLSETDFKWLQNGTHFGMYSVLHSYCGESMTYKSKSGKQLEPIMLWVMYQIPLQKTYVWTLPVYARNEGDLAQMCELLRDILKTLGLRADEMAGMKIFSNGDLFTVLKER